MKKPTGKRRKAPKATSGSEAASDYLIQVDVGRPSVEMSDVKKMLAGAKIDLDASYGPILIDPVKGRYVVRGTATPSARQYAEANIPGVQFFGDPRIAPTTPDG
jgi:hypothetical protein